MSALILDGHLKSALCAVRSLGGKGASITVGGERESALSLHSKYVHSSFVYASPKNDPDQFLRDVERAARAMGEKPVLFTFSDATSLLFAREREKVTQWGILVLPPQSSVEIASDKHATYALATSLGIPTIQTYEQTDFNSLTFPLVVKNRHSIVWREGVAVEGSARFVFSHDELERSMRDVIEKTGEVPLIMEFIKGDEYGIEMVCKEGVPLCTFVHKRVRSLSPKGGAAVVKETAPEDENTALMREYAHRLVRELSWSGPVMVEFKIDSRNGSVYLMEVNGRFWGSLPLAVVAGIDFPWYSYALAQGGMPDVIHANPVFARTRHFLGDFKWFVSVFFASDRMRGYLYPSRLRALWDFKTEIFKSRGDIFSWNDPLPSLFEYIDILNKWKSKA